MLHNAILLTSQYLQHNSKYFIYLFLYVIQQYILDLIRMKEV